MVERVEEDTDLGHVAAEGTGLDHVLKRQAHCEGRSLACTLRADRLRALDAPRCVGWADCEDQREVYGRVSHREGKTEIRLGSFRRCGLLGAARSAQRSARLDELGGLRRRLRIRPHRYAVRTHGFAHAHAGALEDCESRHPQPMAAEHSASGGEGGRTETAAPAEIAGELSAKMITHARQSFEIASPLPLLARRERRLLGCNRK